MSKNINFENFILYISMILLIFEIIFLYWLNPIKFGYNRINLFIIPISLMLILLHAKKDLMINKKTIIIYILIIYILLNYLFAPFHSNFFRTLLTNNILPIMLLIYFKHLSKNNIVKNKIIKALFIFFNIFNIINFIIILKQINTPFFMMPFYNLSENKFYLDHLTGFFGMNGTHILSTFYLIVIYLNCIFLKDNRKTTRKFALICLIFTIISSIYISGFNDNKTYYFMLILYLIPLILDVISKFKNNKKIIRIVFAFLVLTFSFFILIFTNQKLKSIFYDRIYNDLIQVSYNAVGTNKDERLQLFLYSLEFTEKYPFGVGIGGINDINLPTHMGISELSAKTITGGITYLILFILLFYFYFIEISNLKSLKYRFMILLFLLFAVYYQQLFINSCETTMYCMLMLIIGEYFSFKNRGVTNETEA